METQIIVKDGEVYEETTIVSLDKISSESIQATIDTYVAQRDGLNALIAELVKKKEMVKEMEAKI